MKIKEMLFAALLGGLTAVGAWLTIPLPFSLVPITFQMFFSLLAGLWLGARWGALSQVVYLAIGAIGLPVFSGGKAGLPVLMGPTGGFLVGFVLAAFLIGKLTEKVEKLTFARAFFSMVLGTALVYLLGVIQLSWVAELSFRQALMTGVVPFIIPDLLKIGAATLVGVQVQRALKRAQLIGG